jgi:hypothetical protein
MPQLANMPQLTTRRLAHLARLALAAALLAIISAPDLALAQTSPFMTGASALQTNARTAREYLVALPAELSPQARINLVRGFSRELVERYRFALDIAIHAPRDYPGSDPRNFHAHLLATTREVTPTGLGAKTTLEWSDTNRHKIGLGRAVGELLYVREHWGTAANAALEQEHINARIDHRTLKAQGIDREPRPHIPHAAFEMERHGYRSVVAERIRADYQARVEARLQRLAQHEPRAAEPKSPKDLATESALRWAAQHGQTHHKSSEDMAMEAALRWKVQYGQAHHKSPEDMAQESAMRWLRYRQAQLQEQVQGKAPAKELVREREHEREQNGPIPASGRSSRDYDLSL